MINPQMSFQVQTRPQVSKGAPVPRFDLGQIKDPGYSTRVDFDQPSDLAPQSAGVASIEEDSLDVLIAEGHRRGRINGFFWGLGVGALAAFILARAL